MSKLHERTSQVSGQIKLSQENKLSEGYCEVCNFSNFLFIYLKIFNEEEKKLFLNENIFPHFKIKIKISLKTSQ